MLKFSKSLGPNCYKITLSQRFSSIDLAQPVQQEQDTQQTSWEKAKPFSSIPGPTPFQLISRSLPGGRYHGLNIIDESRKISDDFGKITKIPSVLGSTSAVLITDPNDFEIVYRNEGRWPNRRRLQTYEYYRKNFRSEIFKEMPGTVSSEGKEWGKMRSMSNPILLNSDSVNSYIPAMDDISMEFMEQIKMSRDHNNELPANFMQNLNAWALESISYIGLNQRLHVIGLNKNTDVKALDLVEAVADFFQLSFDLDFKPSIWRYVSTPKFRRLMAAMNCITDTTIHYIEKTIEEIENNPPLDNEKRQLSIFEKLLEVDKKFAIVTAIDMMTAGVDTTSAAVCYLLYHLAKNPDKQEKLRLELKRLPMDENGRLMTSSLNRVPYLRACMKEAARLSPVFPGLGRAVTNDVSIKGYQIPKGTFFMIANPLSYSDENLFKEPEKFIPERWLREKEPDACPAMGTSNPFVLLPFGYGPRQCLGKRIAEMEMSVFIACLLKQFNVEFNYGPLKSKKSIVATPISDLKFKLTEL